MVCQSWPSQIMMKLGRRLEFVVVYDLLPDGERERGSAGLGGSFFRCNWRRISVIIV